MPLSKKQEDKALKNSIKDGSAYSAMDGITSTYSTPFALALGASNAEIGILNSIPNLFITLSQRFAGKYIEKRGRKNICESLSLMQKLIWIPIILIPVFFIQEGVFFFILLLTSANVVVNFANTAWASWMGDLVPEKIRGSYFGKRNTLQAICSFLTTLAAGWLLGFTKSLFGFSIIFFIAFIFGMISYLYLTKIPEVRPKIEKSQDTINVLGFVKDIKKYKNFRPFKNHMTLLNFAVNIASPFFTVYMLNVMGIGYEWYGIVIASEILTRILMLRYWGKLSDKFGDKVIMSLCNILIVFYPFLFLFVRNSFHLILISVFSGMAWSGFDLTSFNYLLDVTPSDKRSSYIADYKVSVGTAAFLSPLIGGFLSQYLSTVTIISLAGLQILFLLSFALRAIVTAYGLPSLKEVRAKKIFPVSDVFLKAFAVYPMRGIAHELIYVHNRFDYLEKDIIKKVRSLKIKR